MPFRLKWTERALAEYNRIEQEARRTFESRQKSGKRKSSRQEGLFVQVAKSLRYLAENPRHPGLNTHEYISLDNPYEKGGKVFCAYAQSSTPGGYRIFWCYGPGKGEITIVAITPHP